MKALFIKQFNYDLFVNNQTLHMLEQSSYPEKPVQIMAHLLAAQQVWLNRLLNLSIAGIELWPPLGGHYENLEEVLTKNHAGWINYLKKVSENELNASVDYQTTKGEKFSNFITDIITQVINHGTHHRAQIGQMLKTESAIELPLLDYIFYVRKLNS